MDRKRNVIEISSDESDSDIVNRQIKHEFRESKYARYDAHPTIYQDQNSQGVELTSASNCMLPLSSNLSHREVAQHRLEEHWKHSFRGARYFINSPDTKFVPQQNTQQAETTNTSKEFISLDDTLSQKLYTKIVINENNIEIILNRSGIKPEHGIQGIRYDRNDAQINVSQEFNFQKVSTGLTGVKESPKIHHLDLLPLIEILSQDIYRKIFITENKISIVRNTGEQMKNGFRGKRPARTGTNHTVPKESVTQKTSNIEQRPLYDVSLEKQLLFKKEEKDQTYDFYHRKKLNSDPHLTSVEDQKANLVERTDDDTKILLPNDTSPQNLYNKILISESFIGIVRNRHHETQGNSFRGMRYGRIDTHPTISQTDSDELSSEDLLPLIKILSQNLFSKISIGRSFIGIKRNTGGEQRKPGFGEKKYARPFGKMRYARSMTHTIPQNVEYTENANYRYQRRAVDLT